MFYQYTFALKAKIPLSKGNKWSTPLFISITAENVSDALVVAAHRCKTITINGHPVEQITYKTSKLVSEI